MLKKIIVLIAAAIMLIRFLMFQCFAIGAAPVVAGEEIAEILIAMLLGAGHSQSELSGMSVTQMQSVLNDDLNNGLINHGTVLIDPITQKQMTVLEFLQSDTVQAIAAVQSAATAKFISDYVDGLDYIFKPTSTTDLMGGGAKAVLTYPNGAERVFTCSYIVVDTSDGYDRTRITIYSGDGQSYQYDLQKDGTYKLTWQSGSSPRTDISSYGTTVTDFGIMDKGGVIYQLYGDVRTIDGETFPTEDEWEYQLGDVDGTPITPDMLNPDGTVTIDGVTYDPVDYLDPDKLTDEGKDKLIYNITNVINNTYVVSDDKPIVDEDDITVEVAEELENYTVPTGIITVFPFCLPFDFVRGIKTLVKKPEVPVFKAELDLTDFCGYDLGKHTIEISFEKWEPAAVICRWFFILLFTYTLILLTGKIVKGAGA